MKKNLLLKYLLLIMFSALLILSAPVTAQTDQKSYGPVQNNEALWLIADKLRTDNSVSTAQMAVALFNQNPHAFINQNINNLSVGVTLVVPNETQLRQLSKREAESVFQQQWQVWQDSNGLTVGGNTSGSVGDSGQELLSKPLADDNQAGENHLVNNPFVDVNDNAQVSENNNSVLHNIQNTDHPVKQLTALDKPENLKNLSLLDYMAQIEITSYINNFMSEISQSITNMSSSINLHQLDFVVISLSSLPVRILLVVLLVFLTMVYFFRRQEANFIQFDPDDFQADVIPQLRDEVKKPSFSNTIPKTDLPESDVTPDEDFESEIIDHSSDIVAEQVDVYQFLNTDQGSKIGLLEKAFDDTTLTEMKLPQADELPDDAVVTENILDSIEQIKYVQDSARHSKIEAFLKATHSEASIEQLFENEYINIREHEKVDVFIEEFEQQIGNLIKYAQLIKKAPDELENLIQFNLSNHLIKVLSEMMEASHLTRFSQTIVHFLDDIIDGKSSLSTEVINRLAVVVDFYYQYSCSIKGHESAKVEG